MSQAVITWIGGPVLRARMTGPFSVYEAVSVGPRRLLGEVIQLKGEELVAQVYEDTTGMEPGDTVSGTGRALSVNLGPGLRIRHGLACVDATAAGLLASRERIEAELLAELDALLEQHGRKLT